VAVAAIGEAFCYAGDPAAGPAALAQRLSAIHAALVPHGILLFDVSGPGRGGPSGVRHVVSSRGGIKVTLEEREDEGGLGRTITLLVPEGDHYRRVEERHRLRVYPPGQIEAFLSGAGFAWERLDGYDQLPLLPGWHAWAATPRPGTGGGH
jgi:hypothetical protein